MEKKRDLYEECVPYICYKEELENVFDKNNSDIKDIVFIQSNGNGVIVRDFWNYYYKIKNITITEIIEDIEIKDDLLLIGQNVLINMRYVDTINTKYIQIGSHLMPIDDKIKKNLYNYQKLIILIKEKYDKICDRAEESDYENERARCFGQGKELFGPNSLFKNWGSS